VPLSAASVAAVALALFFHPPAKEKPVPVGEPALAT